MVIAYQDGDAFLFKVTDGANGRIDAAETILGAEATDLFELVGTYENVALGAFTASDFIA